MNGSETCHLLYIIEQAYYNEEAGVYIKIVTIYTITDSISTNPLFHAI